MTFTLTSEQYEALIALANAGALTPDKKRQLDDWLQLIEKANNITRYKLWIQWQEGDQALPPTTQFPESWPPSLRYYLELLTRPISKDDVAKVLKARASNPVTVLVTPDPGAVLGWTPLDEFFVQ